MQFLVFDCKRGNPRVMASKPKRGATRCKAKLVVPGSPGSHPHSDRPNWQPAEIAEEYLRNCREGLEVYSDRHMAKLLGISRAHLWRWKLMADIPEELFERLLAESNHVPSTSELANVARALNGRGPSHDAEHCPHCGKVLRVRSRWRPGTAKIVNEWLSEKAT